MDVWLLVATVAVLILMLVAFFQLHGSQATVANPFEKDCRQGRKPYIHDQKERDSVLFISFPSSKDPEWSRHPGRQDKATCAIVTLANWEWFKEWDGKPVKKR